MDAIVGGVFAPIHYRPWPTSTVVGYFEQIVIRRRLGASINAIDGASASRRLAAARGVARGALRPPALFPPPLLHYSRAGKQLYPRGHGGTLIAPTRTRPSSFADAATELMERKLSNGCSGQDILEASTKKRSSEENERKCRRK